MDRKLKTRNEMSLRSLEDDELSQVAGGCGHRRKHHHHHHDQGGDGGALAAPGAGAPPAGPGPGATYITNDITIFQIVAGNTAPVTLLNILGLAG